ncbi:MAG: hypothetical protein ABR540_04800 [Acidimicrobiales bacterium]|nr:hypothetical protein [Actinomycetota bacterium]
MRKHTTTSTALVGQLLFAEERPGTVILDCVLTREGSGTASLPVTLEARFPGRTRAAAALDLLLEWAQEGADVAVRINEGRRGPEVEISSGSARLILEPED